MKKTILSIQLLTAITLVSSTTAFARTHSTKRDIPHRMFSTVSNKLSCPAGFELDSASRLCIKDAQALGPFTEAMKAACIKEGGEEACDEILWDAKFAKDLRGPDQCMFGADLMPNGLCVEGENAFGPFTKSQIDKCLVNDGSEICNTMRWSTSFAQNLAGGEWIDLSSEFAPNKQKLKSYMSNDSEWSVDIRVITPVNKYIVVQHRGNVGLVPASTNKITSAISAHLNVGTSWADMQWWILESNNDAAERAWQAGGKRAGILKALSSIGVEPPSEWKNVDGSGLSYNNTVPSTFLVDLLLAVKEQPWYAAFRNALPTSCQSGTMKAMFCANVETAGKIHAKTGTLNSTKGVKALAGFGLTQSGNLLIFSTIYNGPAQTAVTKGSVKIQAIVTEAMRIANAVE